LKLLVTGNHGQLVSSLLERAASVPQVELVNLGRPDLDLLDPPSVHRAIAAIRPDIVVSAAAHTAVDQAEDEPELAHAINVLGAAAVAEAAAAIDAPVIHLSTDYVFAGDSRRPYVEDDPTGPRSVYGRTKWAGEQAVAAANPRHLILRTAWVYSPFAKNFLKTMLRLAYDRDEISVVCDQWGNPTSALDLADAILHAARNLTTERYGTYHVAGTGDTNWAEFARSGLAASQSLGGPHAQVRDIVSAQFPAKARRPINSRLCCDKFADVFGWRAPPWQDSMQQVVRRLVAEA
jgi:dTDP-4-dehydrorhamnose reductase